MHCRAWRRITLLTIVSWLLYPDGDACGPQSDASAMCHVRTALSVTDPSLPPAPAHGTSCCSASRHWTITDYLQRTFENIPVLRRVLRPRRICDIYYLFAPFINLLTYLLTYIPFPPIIHHSPLPQVSTSTASRSWRLCRLVLSLPQRHTVI